jgi:hypothetical protein
VVAVIELPDRLEVDQMGKLCKSHTFTSIVVSITASSVKICTLAATVGVEVECRGAVVLPVTSALPLGWLGLGVWGLLCRRRTSLSEPVAPTPSYSVARQGPTSLLMGWASPIWMRVKGPMGRCGEINPTFPP